MTEFPEITVAGKTAVVVGGTSGIGEGIALAFADDGADVVATSRTEAAVADTAEKIRGYGVETLEQTCDVTDYSSIEALRDSVLETFGQVDILVNSVGTAARTEFLDLSEEGWLDVIDVLLNGVFRSCQAFAREMDEGSIINISSMSADLARSRLMPYCAAKAGVNSLTQCAAKELAPDVRVNAIAPGFVMTPLTKEEYAEGTEIRKQVDDRTPVGRVADREEIVGSAIYLGSEAASFTTGEVVYVDGGFTKNAL
ncbi:SDR family NAD(P)-dependent oxidoreductase [Halococcus saccharolyticus]|uniref:Short-chain dehydrogenase/reductase SDR n=1 Tax=Halococcus saccharolyticus DSM 5350 TaxID=1227455 RepID=M0MML0_9EURY|nr:SDR family oxidoreductase [Halococcus saccharolyticus]EMA46927.1 short-chain dehydrogenase/reductase SDR [Halococcus saccharolyticus DSM 5350]